VVAGREWVGGGGSGVRRVLLGGGGGREEVAVELDIEPDISNTKLIRFQILPGLLCRL
jgi:hypothetical protein